jgi:hypothetical protein
MKKLSLMLLAFVIAGCAETRDNGLHAGNTAMHAATLRIIASGDNDPGHSQQIILGKVHAACAESPNRAYVTARGIITNSDGLRQAAYREYGTQVDAIVDADASYVDDGYVTWTPLFSRSRHFEREGTAVHFQDSQQMAGESR